MNDNTPFQGEPSSWAKYWSLDPTIAFFNHGSYGACPLPVLEAQQRLRSQLERQPLRFFMREYEALLDAARSQLAAFVGADADELVFVPNATTGVNAVLRSAYSSTRERSRQGSCCVMPWKSRHPVLPKCLVQWLLCLYQISYRCMNRVNQRESGLDYRIYCLTDLRLKYP